MSPAFHTIILSSTRHANVDRVVDLAVLRPERRDEGAYCGIGDADWGGVGEYPDARVRESGE